MRIVTVAVAAGLFLATSLLSTPAVAGSAPAEEQTGTDSAGFYAGASYVNAFVDDNGAPGWGVNLGYSFNRYFGVEGGWISLGSLEFVGGDSDVDGPQLVGVLTYPISDLFRAKKPSTFSLVATAGVFFWDMEDLDNDGNDFTFSLGLKHHLKGDVTVRLEYEKFFGLEDVGGRDVAAEAITLSLNYEFGSFGL
ncbi:MAG: outer membrane beta-barrel protein [Candidatus Binatia bacterium]